ncbi:MAG: TIGR00730 family Rossman fold protein [Ruminococcaceae bacterium]|nr:TIGR00730 family Rossman fold protein [Oscillospiraceae bacterium]
MNITLYGAASERIDRAYINGVEELGRAIAKRGHTMVFGAGSTGLMGAAVRGMHEEGGHVIGVTPRFMDTLEPVSPLCTELITTETMAERKTIMEEKADAFVITPGGVGTLDEFFQILTLKILGRLDKPVVLYNINGYWDGILAAIGTSILKGFISPAVADDFCLCETPESVFKVIEGKHN